MEQIIYPIKPVLLSALTSIVQCLCVIFVSATLSSCNKRDPNPETKDAAYLQTNKDLAEAKVALNECLANIEQLSSDKRNAVPQSGENKPIEKKLNEAQEYKTLLLQRVRQYEVMAAERTLFVQKKYLQSLLPNGAKWPDQENIESALLDLKILRDKHIKSKKSKPEPDVPRGTSESSHAEKPGAETTHGKPAEHGSEH